MLSTNLGDPPKGWALFVDLYRRDVAGDQSKWERFCDALLNGKIENQVFSEADGGLNPVPARVWRRRNVRRQEHSLFQTGVIKVAQNLHDVDATAYSTLNCPIEGVPVIQAIAVEGLIVVNPEQWKKVRSGNAQVGVIGQKRERKNKPEIEAALCRRMTAVKEAARKRWPDPAKRPASHRMAAVLTDADKKKLEGFALGSVRQILDGTYPPAIRRQIGRLD